MATIRSQLVLNDGISGVLKKINVALKTTLDAFEQVQRASGQAVDTSQIHAARAALAEAVSETNSLSDAYKQAAQEEEKLNQGIRNGTKAADGMLGKVKGIVATLAAGAGIKSLLNLSDQMTGTAARLSFIVDDGGTVEELEQKIMASAQRSRASYLDTASAIASMGANAGRAFESNDELIAFMEQVNKQFVIGGATAEGQSAAMLQLTQAMAAGALRGEELNSILENAPGIARAIESYMGVAEGSIKSYAEQGLITADVVKNALLSAAGDTYDEMGNLIEGTNSKFESMPMTWAQVWTKMQNTALAAFDPVLSKLNQVANSAQFNTVINGAITALATLAAVASGVLDLLINGAAFVVDNWSWIAPIVYGVAAAFLLYNGYLAISNGLQLISNIQKGLAAVSAYAHAAATNTEARATAAATAAQYGFNAALLACPLTWILLIIIAVIAAIYAVVAAVNHFAGTSVSATGIIAGAFATLGAHIINTFIVPAQNALATFINFLGNAFNDPIAAIQIAFYDMCLTVIGYIRNLAQGIEDLLNKIPGVTVDITSGLDSFYSGLEQAQQAVKDESGWVEYVQKMDFIDYSDAASAGYEFGQGIESSVGSLFDFDLGAATDYGTGSNWDSFAVDDIADYTGQTADNTGAAADALTASTEELAYLRDIAEREAINRFTTAEVRIDMTGMTNRIEGGADLDGVIATLTDGFTEALLTAAEGVHA